MTVNEISNIQRALGRIEGVALAVDNKIAAPLLESVKVISLILTEKEGENNDR